MKNTLRIWAPVNCNLIAILVGKVRLLNTLIIREFFNTCPIIRNLIYYFEGHYVVVPADFNGVPVGIPGDAVRHLTVEYGDMYDEPDVNFIWDVSARNLFIGRPRWRADLVLNSSKTYCALV